MSVLEELRRTPKGRLKYDRHGLSMQSIEGVLTDIQSDMDSMQVSLSSPPTFSPEPSFGLCSGSEAGSPLVVRTIRLVSPTPGGCAAAAGRRLPSIQVTLQNNAAVRKMEDGGAGTQQHTKSIQSMKVTADLATPKLGTRVVKVAPRPDITLSPVSSIDLSPASPRSLMKPWPGVHSTPITPRTIDLSDSTAATPGTIDLSAATSNEEDASVEILEASGHGVENSAPGINASVNSPLRNEPSTSHVKEDAVLNCPNLSAEAVQIIASPKSDGAEDKNEGSSVKPSPVNRLLQPGPSGNSPFTPRTHDKVLEKERQKHLEEAKEEGLVRLAAAEAQLKQLRVQHQLAQQQLAAEQLRRQLEERELHGAEQLRSEQQLQQTTEKIEEDRRKREQEMRALLERRQADAAAVRERTAHQRHLLDQTVAAQKQLRASVTNIVNKIKTCDDRARLQTSGVNKHIEQLKTLMAQMETLVQQGASDRCVQEATGLVQTARGLETLICQQIDEINAAAAPVQQTPAAPSTAAQVAPVVDGGRQTAQVAPPAPGQPPAAPAEPARPGELAASLQEAQQLSDQLRQKLAQFQTSFADIVADPQWKKFKFDCQKAVNTPINAISPVSAAHLKDKLDKLQTLLRGQPVLVSGQQQVSAAAHPRGTGFCLDLVAKKFVRQGEDVVSSKPEAAFALAAVFAALEREFPALTELTAAHLLATCPYLAPVYPQQLADDSDETYYRKLGYDYSDGVVERQDKFLKRMSGVARLYAALLIARPPQGTPSAPPPAAGAAPPPPPLCLAHAWHWLSAVANLEPRADITATLLFDMLEVAGSTLAAAYGRQFFKLVHLLHVRYLPLLQQVTPDGCGGPVVRLEQRLQGILTSGRVLPPAGQLKLYGW